MSTHRLTSRSPTIFPSAVLLLCAAAAGCQGEPAEGEEDTGEAELAAETPAQARAKEAKRLFEQETFGGNGRTCATCHSNGTGTISPEDVQARFAEDPNDPLFLHDGSDDFQGNGVTRILADATILVAVNLPPNLRLANDPTATSVVLRRGVPSTKDTPALDPVLMYDGRAPNLLDQANDAIHGHAQATIAPTADQLQMIAEHEKTEKFFTSSALRYHAIGAGPPPGLPAGVSPAQKRGRTWFEDVAVPIAINPNTPRNGLCRTCHTGVLLNQTNGKGWLPKAPFPTPPETTSCNQPATEATQVPAGRRFDSVLVAELNIGNHPTYNFLLELPNGAQVPLPPIADPGRALITGRFDRFPALDGDLFKFKIPSLRGVKKSAPYFHDNSAKTLEAVVDHYATFFALATDCNIDGDPPLLLTDQDKADLLAFLKLL